MDVMVSCCHVAEAGVADSFVSNVSCVQGIQSARSSRASYKCDVNRVKVAALRANFTPQFVNELRRITPSGCIGSPYYCFNLYTIIY